MSDVARGVMFGVSSGRIVGADAVATWVECWAWDWTCFPPRCSNILVVSAHVRPGVQAQTSNRQSAENGLRTEGYLSNVDNDQSASSEVLNTRLDVAGLSYTAMRCAVAALAYGCAV